MKVSGKKVEAPLPLRTVVSQLEKLYGPPAAPPTTDPFELVLLENVAYLAKPAKRLEAFALLRETIGTSPERILAAPARALERVTARGILAKTFAGKLRECARIAVEELHGELDATTRGPLREAVRALRKFPGIGEPGAEKILTFAGRQALLAPDSNGLRVLTRIGLVAETGSYAKNYAAAREAAFALPSRPETMREAHLLLQEHGRTLCKTSAPACERCPLARGCAHALAIRRKPSA